jgi:ABC-type branched-subunit amino acid transport system permease subunit
MRAVVDNPTLVGLTGERPLRVRRAAWAIGSAFAALSGILLAPTVGLDALLLTLLVIQAFGAAAIGLFSNLPATYLGGILVGIAASVATKYFTTPPFSGIPSAMPFVILVVVLLVVPVSKFPQRRASARSLVSEASPMSRRSAAMVAVLGGAGLLLVPALVGTKLPLWTSMLSYVVIFGSLALLVWTSGQLSLCHAAFVAVGATTFGHLTNDLGLPWVVALLLAGLLTVPVGALVAIPAIRLSGIYLALATLGFGIMMQNVIYPTFLMFGSQLNVTASRPRLGFIDGSDKSLYYIVLVVAALTCAALTGIYRSRPGRLLRALSESPTMLVTHGLEVNMIRLAVFSGSAFFAGVGGALALAQTSAASGATYGPIQSLVLLAVLAVCGTRLLRSSILAAVLYAVVPGYVTGFGVDRQIFVFGITAIVSALLVAKRPDMRAWVNRSASASDDRFLRDPVKRRPPASPRREPRPESEHLEPARPGRGR